MKPLFNELSEARLQKAIDLMRERGEQYSDTMRLSQWTITRAVAKTLGFINITVEEARAIAVAGLCDVKHDRFEGGYREDNVDDGINYLSILPGLVELAKVTAKPAPEIRPLRYGVHLVDIDAGQKIKVIKAIREHFKGISLTEAKQLSESIGQYIATFDSKIDANCFSSAINYAGAVSTVIAI